MAIFHGNMLSDTKLAECGFRSVGKDVQVSDRADIFGTEHITLGDNVRIDDYTIISATASVTIGSHIHIANHCSIIAGAEFIMEDYSTLSVGVRVFTHSDDFSGESMTNPTIPEEFKQVRYEKISIGRHVVVGANSVVLPGSVLEEGVAVGAMSLVGDKLPAWGIYGGVPATRIKERSKNLLAMEKQFREQYEQA